MVKKGSLAVLTFSVLLLPAFALAHETRVYEIDGEPFIFVVGSLNEPIAVDDRTGVDLRVLRADPTDPTNRSADGVEPVSGLESTLEVELQAGEERMVLPLSPSWGEVGRYQSIFYPTVATTYTYRFIGEIEGTEVDLSFACNPAGHVGGEADTEPVEISDSITQIYAASDFGCPTDRTNQMFPEQAERSLALTGQLAELQRQQQRDRWLALTAGVVALVTLILYVRRPRTQG